jgi:hypothetical protein
MTKTADKHEYTKPSVMKIIGNKQTCGKPMGSTENVPPGVPIPANGTAS